MKTSENGINLIKKHEGLRLVAYRDIGGVWTIGYGHTRLAKAGKQITKSEAEKLLMLDIADAERIIKLRIRVPLNQNQHDALVSFVFNLGPKGLGPKSTLRRILNRGNYIDVPEQIKRWDKVITGQGAKSVPGLTRRREAEAELWATPVPGEL